MPDPTLTDDPGAEWTDNEVREILATEPIQGAATGAAYGGIGLANRQASQLANRTAFLKQRQDVNITNIASLLAWLGLFEWAPGYASYSRTRGNPSTGTVNCGVLRIGISPNGPVIMAEWIDGPPTPLLSGEQITYTLPTAFAGVTQYSIQPTNGGLLVAQTSASQFTVENPMSVSGGGKVICLGVG
jgi:hypothetical protein